MGYTTTFSGSINVDPPLSNDEIEFLTKFSRTRRMLRHNGPYFVDGSGTLGQGDDPDIIDRNTPPKGQPGLWCKWRPTEDGAAIEWNGWEKFYSSVEWMEYLIEHFLKPGHIAQFPFLGSHVCNGTIKAQGEDMDDRWKLVVIDNVVTRVELE